MSDGRSLWVHQPGRDWVATPGELAGSLLELLRSQGVEGLRTPCGGVGTCGKCVVRARIGAAEPRHLLACRVPALEVDEVWLEAPGELEIQTDFAAPPGAAPARPERPVDGHGIAIDVGTTTVAAALVGPGGVVLARASDRNRQAAFGADVISRIAKSDELGSEVLAGVLREQLADLAGYLLDCAGVPAAALGWYAIAGNTVMEHFVAGLSPASIGVAPFAPLSLFGDAWSASELGLPGGAATAVQLLPAVAGYVGGDVSAGALACELDRVTGVTFLLDLGTNGEIVLATPERLVACATAAGPAFEGAQIECGMPAVAGAIDRVTVGAGQLRVSTILDATPIGICGSGLVDALAAALRLGLVDETGRLRSREEVRASLAGYLAPAGEPPRLLLSADGSVYLSQADIRALQLAKGAIAAGVDVLLAAAGLSYQDVDQVLLAGGFGTRVRPRSLATIGLIPPVMAEKAVAVGNAALAGCIRVGADLAARERGRLLAQDCHYLELSLDPRFTSAFIERIGFDPAPVQSLAEAMAVAREQGFETVHELDPATAEPREQVRSMCSADLCRTYGRNWACPPACGSLDEFRTQLSSYRIGLLVQTVGQLEDQFDIDAMKASERLHKRRFRRLAEELSGSYPRQLGLGAGACDLCPTCTYPTQPCRLPGLRTVSMEAAGLFVTEVCERNSVPYYHGPATVTYTSCVLLE